MSETNLPTVNFNADRTLITEGGEAQLLIFSLSKPAPEGGLVVKINIDDPDGEGADTEFHPELISNIVDFGQIEEDGVITASLTIAEGETEAMFGISAIADDLDEGIETYSLTLLEGEDYITDPNSTIINTIIEETMTTTTVSLTPETLIATEGETFAWNFSLDQPAPSEGLSLFLPITVNNDPAPGDVEYNIDGSENISDFEFVTNNDLSVGFNLTIAEGATEAVLVSEAVADDIAETDESFTTVIADGVDYQANPEQNEVTTIITELPVVSLVTESVTAEEGETFTWDFSLNQPAPEGGLTLFLPVTVNNDPAPGDVEYNIDGSSNIADFEFVVEDDVSIGFNLTIAEGATEASLVSEVVADDVPEEDEIFTTVIADGENYRANPAQSEVVTTLTDISTDLVGEAIAIENFSFEIPALPSAEESPGNFFLSVTESPTQTVPGWKAYNPDGLITGIPLTPGAANFTDTGISNVSSFYPEGASDGINAGYAFILDEVGSGVVGLSQTLDEQLTANTRYTLQVDVGNPASNPFVADLSGFPGYQVQLLAGGEVLAQDNNSLTIAEGEFETSTVTFTAPQIDSSLGEQLEIRLVNISEPSGLESNDKLVDFDNVRLFAETAEPTLPTLSLSAEPTEVNEGEQLLWNFSLTEAVGEGGLTVALDLVEDTDPLPGDISYFVDRSENVTDFELVIDEESGLIDQALVTLAEGATEATLVSDIIADNATEGEESVVYALGESDEYSINSEDNTASFTILDTSTDLNTSTSISLELEDLLVPALEAVADVTFNIDYISGIEDSDFINANTFADSIESYLASEPESGDFFEVVAEDLTQFLSTDAGLGLSEVAESITVEFDVEPYPAITFPFSVESTVEIA